MLASLPTVGLALPQFLWVLDFLTGARIAGMTSYMFDPKLPLFVRGLSSFHGWLPFLLLWMVWRLGYDRRAFLGWTLITWAVLLASFFLAPPSPGPGRQSQAGRQSQLRARPELREAANRDAPAALAGHHDGRLPPRLVPAHPSGAEDLVPATAGGTTAAGADK